MNYSRAFSYVFEDKNWLSKILIAGLISLIPVIGQLYLLGWMVEIVRRVKANRTDIIPATHFSYFLTLGLKLFVVSLIYSIPVIILSCIVNLISGAAGAGNSSDFAQAFYTGMSCFGSLLSFVLSLAISILGTYGTIKLAETDQIKACLDFSDAFNCIKANLSAFIIVELLAIVAGLIQSLGVVVCFVGIIFTAPYGTAIIGNLVGQLWDNLNPWHTPVRPVRGTVNNAADDMIQEAPFTKVEDIEKAAEDARSYAGEVVEEVQESAEEVIDETADAVENIAEDVLNKTQEASGNVQDLVEDVTEDLQDTAETAVEEIRDAAENAAETAEEIIEADAPAENIDEKPAAEIPENNDDSGTLPPFE